MIKRKKLSVDSSHYTYAYFMNAGGGKEYFSNELGDIYKKAITLTKVTTKDKDRQIVLDLGCGRGELLREYARNGNICYGVDYAEAAIQIAQKTMDDLSEVQRRNTHIIKCDLKEINFENNMFDAIFMLDALEHLYPWELDIIIPKVYKMLCPGGVFIVHTYPTKLLNDCIYGIMGLLGMVPTSKDVHPNVQSALSLSKILRRYFGRHFNIWYENRPKFWSQNLHPDYNKIIKRAAYLFDYIYDNRFFSKVLRLPLLRHFFSTDIWAVAFKEPVDSISRK